MPQLRRASRGRKPRRAGLHEHPRAPGPARADRKLRSSCRISPTGESASLLDGLKKWRGSSRVFAWPGSMSRPNRIPGMDRECTCRRLPLQFAESYAHSARVQPLREQPVRKVVQIRPATETQHQLVVFRMDEFSRIARVIPRPRAIEHQRRVEKAGSAQQSPAHHGRPQRQSPGIAGHLPVVVDVA